MSAQWLNILFFLTPGFSPAALGCAIESLTALNQLRGKRLLGMRLVSVSGGPVESSGFSVLTEVAPEQVAATLTLVLAGAPTAADRIEAKLRTRLRAYAASGAVLAGVGHGIYPLAAAGVLDGYQCVVPPELAARFSAEFPGVHVVSGHTTYIDRDRASSLGGTSVLGLMLALVDAQSDEAVAGQVSAAIAGLPRLPNDAAERASEAQASGSCDRRLARAIRLMQSNLARPLPIGTLSSSIGLSERELERLCGRTFGCSPSQLYLQLRLQSARRLIIESRDPVLAVALKCGFADTSHLDRHYRRSFRETPRGTRDRREGDDVH